MKKLRAISLLLAVLLLVGLFAACAQPKQPDGTTKKPDPTPTKPPAQTTASPKPTDPPADPENPLPDLTDDPAPAEKITLSMFMIDSGVPHPEGVDPKDNPFINWLKAYANVDLDLEVPAYSAYQDRLNVLLGTASLPDVVHAPWNLEKIYSLAADGAFIEIKDYYDNSNWVKKYVTAAEMELSKDRLRNKYWGVPMLNKNQPHGYGVFYNYYLVKKCLDGKVPQTVDEWIEALRELKKQYPDKWPMINRNFATSSLSYGGNIIMSFYGVGSEGLQWIPERNRVECDVNSPAFRKSIEIMRELYNEKLFDTEFATLKDLPYWEKLAANPVLGTTNTIDQYLADRHYQYVAGNTAVKNPIYDEVTVWSTLRLKEYPAEIPTAMSVMPRASSTVIGHRIYIAASAKDKDRCWRLIEGFARPDFMDLIHWGREGVEFEVVDGARKPTENYNNPNSAWRLHLNLIGGFTRPKDVRDVLAAENPNKEDTQVLNDSEERMSALAKKTGLNPVSFVVWPQEVQDVATERSQFFYNFVYNAIMGNTTMEEFDASVAEYMKNWGTLREEIATQYVIENRAELESMGCKYELD